MVGPGNPTMVLPEASPPGTAMEGPGNPTTVMPEASPGSGLTKVYANGVDTFCVDPQPVSQVCVVGYLRSLGPGEQHGAERRAADHQAGTNGSTGHCALSLCVHRFLLPK